MNTQDQADVIIVGRIGGAFGVRGWVRVVSYTDPPQNLLDYQPWLLDDGSGQWRQVEVREVRPHQKGLVAALRNVDSRDQAQGLSGTTIGVWKSVLPEAAPGEYYWRDLIGLTVLGQDGVAIGVVDHLIDSPAHDILVIRTDHGEVLIPYVKQYVTQVDLAQGALIVDWLEA